MNVKKLNEKLSKLVEADNSTNTDLAKLRLIYGQLVLFSDYTVTEYYEDELRMVIEDSEGPMFINIEQGNAVLYNIPDANYDNIFETAVLNLKNISIGDEIRKAIEETEKKVAPKLLEIPEDERSSYAQSLIDYYIEQ